MNNASFGHMKCFTAGLLILIMSFVLVNRALYIHIHVLPDGALVSHSHPFSKNTDDARGKAHQHSSLEVILLEHMEVLIISTSALIVLMTLSGSVLFRLRTEYLHLPSLILPTSGRAPPAGM